MAKRKKNTLEKTGTLFGRLYGGAVGKGYTDDEAAAMAYKTVEEREGKKVADKESRQKRKK